MKRAYTSRAPSNRCRARLYPWLPALALLLDAAMLAAFLVADWQSGLFIAVAVAIALPIGLVMRRAKAPPAGL